MSKVAIYTIITNDYDTVKPIILKTISHYLFTDNPDIVAPGYKIVKVEKTEDQRLQRKLKILIPKELSDYDIVVYVDASITLTAYCMNILRSYKGGFVIGAHPNRKCVYDEGLAVKKLEKAPPELVNKQIAEYYENDFPVNYGMWASGIMIRDKATKEMCELWYKKLAQHTHRDQLSLPWALWKTGTKAIEIPLSRVAIVAPHKKKEPPKVFYSTPFRADKNIGKANNEFVELLPDDSWICITDGDAMFLNSDFGARVIKIINDFGNDYQLIGCLCNRLGGLHQCYNGKFSDDLNVLNHYNIAMGDLRHEVVEGGVAGFFMLFSKATWKKAGGFKENIITSDTEFNKSIKRLGGKVGVYQGLYMFHAYRIDKKGHKEAWRSVNHLK